MRCEKVRHRLNDLLDRTLSAGVEHEVRAHLADCPDCRGEFQLVKNADDILRATVLEMINEIEVPSGLNQRIGQVLAGEHGRSPGKAGLVSLLRAPAFAAAVLVMVFMTGIFGYYRLLDHSTNNPAVVLSLPQDQPVSGSAAGTDTLPPPGADRDGIILMDGVPGGTPSGPASPSSARQEEMADVTDGPAADTGASSAGALVVRQEPPSQGGGAGLLSTEENASGKPVRVPGTEEQKKLMVSSRSSAGDKLSVSLMAAPPLQEALQEATRGAGFAPAVPGYLPSGAELSDVTWSPGTLKLEYRAERNSFQLTQSRVAGPDVAGDEGARLIDINGTKAYLWETGPTGGQNWGYTTIRWQQGEWTFSVGGDFPREEIIKVALSIK